MHPSNVAWNQAQLRLSCGGLGLRSLAHHAPAAFIASLCFSGLAHAHLLQAIEMFNASVHPSDIIHISSLLETFHSQKTLSSMLDNHLFNVLLDSLSISDRARLFSASSPHAASWLTVIPSEVFQTATTCKRGGDVVFCHNKLRDILAEACRRAHFSVQVEATSLQITVILVLRMFSSPTGSWAAACDLSVTSLLNSKILSEAGVTAGAAAHATELRKHEANDVKCNDLG